MSSLKRKPSEAVLQRRVRARRESSEELESIGSDSSLDGEEDADGEEESAGSDSSQEDDEVYLLIQVLGTETHNMHSPNLQKTKASMPPPKSHSAHWQKFKPP